MLFILLEIYNVESLMNNTASGSLTSLTATFLNGILLQAMYPIHNYEEKMYDLHLTRLRYDLWSLLWLFNRNIDNRSSI